MARTPIPDDMIHKNVEEFTMLERIRNRVYAALSCSILPFWWDTMKLEFRSVHRHRGWLGYGIRLVGMVFIALAWIVTLIAGAIQLLGYKIDGWLDAPLEVPYDQYEEGCGGEE